MLIFEPGNPSSNTLTYVRVLVAGETPPHNFCFNLPWHECESYFLASTWRLARVNPDKRITIFRIQDPFACKRDFQKIIASCEIILETNDELLSYETLSAALGEPGERFYVLFFIINIYIYIFIYYRASRLETGL